MFYSLLYSKDLSTSYLHYDILGEAARFSMMTGRRDSLSLIGSGNLSEWVYLETK